MRDREHALLQRQALLRQRSAVLRARWGQDAGAFAPAFGAADLVVDGWRWLRMHPQWPVGALALLAVARPRRLWRWGWRAVWLWRGWRRARPWLAPWWRAAQRAWRG